MTTCARPACSEPIAGYLLLHRVDRIAELLPLDDPIGLRYGVGLCAQHLDRARPPEGWELVDRLTRSTPAPVPPPVVVPTQARPRIHGAPGSPTNVASPVWLPRRGSAADDTPELQTASSPLLRRAFRGETTDAGQIEGQLRLMV